MSENRMVPLERFVAAVVTLAVFAISAWLMHQGIENDVRWDLRSHVQMAVTTNELHILPAHFLLFVVLSVGCWFCTDADRIMQLAPYVIALLIVAKLVVTWFAIRSWIVRAASALHVRIALIGVAVLLSLAFCLPFPNIYRGQFPANQWHNATTTMLMPFAVATFWAAATYLRRPSIKLAVIITLTGIIGMFAKPSFGMAFIPVFPLLLLTVRPMAAKWRLIGLGTVCAIGLVLIGQYMWINHSAAYETFKNTWLDARGYRGNRESGIHIAPFSQWDERTDSRWMSLLSSLLFPLMVLIACGRTALRDVRLWFAWLLFAAGLGAYILFEELGRNMNSGNFGWGAIVTMYMLFLASAVQLLQFHFGDRRARPRDMSEEEWRYERRRIKRPSLLQRILVGAAWCALGAHVIAGISALMRFARDGSYVSPPLT